MTEMIENTAAPGRNLPPEGLILGAESHGPLSSAPVLQWTTGAGDHIVATSHHGFGYKATNEDRVAIIELEDGEAVNLFVVDGMGGRDHGDLAAQILAEELVFAARPPESDYDREVRNFVQDRIETVLWQLPTRELIQRVLKRWRKSAEDHDRGMDPRVSIRLALEAVNSESMRVDDTSPDRLRRIAEVLQTLAGMTPPDAVEIAVRRTQRRIVIQHPGSSPPDACFVGAIVATDAEGRRSADVRQVGDCRMFVASADGAVRFRTIGESVIPEPNLNSPNVALTDLMAYSLHRNLVRNSVNAANAALKRYRKQDVPVPLESGDMVFVYSDGVDDLFSPEELVGMVLEKGPAAFVQELLEHSERRMKHVAGLLMAERKKLPPAQQMRAYPLVHERLNRARLKNGKFEERYVDGTSQSWTKPPKCDNTSICMMVVG